MTVEEIYNKIDKTQNLWAIWVFSMDGNVRYAYINDYYKIDDVTEDIKKSEVEKITVGAGSLFLTIKK